MSRCRSKSFYVAPGVRRYFDECTLATRGPDGVWVEFSHRGDVARFAAANPGWDGVCWVGPAGGVVALRAALVDSPAEVELWRLDARVVEGRRPVDAAGFALHRVAVGGVGRAGGARQVAVDAFPGAGRGVLAAVEVAVRRGDVSLVWVVSAGWRAGVLRSEVVVELLSSPLVVPVSGVWSGLSPELVGRVCGGLGEREVVAVLGGLADPFASSAVSLIRVARVASDPEVLARVALSDDPQVLLTLVRNPACPVSVLLSVLGRVDEFEAHEFDVVLLKALAGLDPLPVAVAELLAVHPLDVRFELASNPSVSSELLARLAAESDVWRVSRAVVGNPACDRETFEAVAGDVDLPVFRRVAVGSRWLSAELAWQAWGEGDSDVHLALLANPVCPAELLELGARGVHRSAAVALLNPSCPVPVLVEAARSGDSARMSAVAKSPAAPGWLVDEVCGVDRSALFAAGESGVFVDGRLSLGVVAAAAVSEGADVRGAAAAVRGLPVELQERLAADPDRLVRSQLAGNPSVSLEVKVSMFAGADTMVSTGLSRALRDRRFVEPDAAECVRVWEFAKAAGLAGPGSEVAWVLMRCGACPSWVLEEIASGLVGRSGAESPGVVAAHPACPLEVVVSVVRERGPVMSAASTVPVLVRLVEEGCVGSAAWLAGVSPHVESVAEAAVVCAELGVGVLPVPMDRQVARLFDSVASLEGGAVRPAGSGRVSGVDDLVGSRDVPFRWSDEAGQDSVVDRVDGVVFGESGWVGEVIRSPRMLSDNASFMGNCTESYEDSVRFGECVLLSVVDPAVGRPVFNVELFYDGDGGWVVGEVNSRFNAGAAGSQVVVDTLAELGFGVRSSSW